MSHTDNFWKLFWMVVGIFVLLYIIAIVALAYLYNPTATADAAAVGVVFDSSRDPFSIKRPEDKRPDFTGEYFYEDSLPLAFADWSWGARINWDSSDAYYEGSNSFKITFLQDWSGMRVNASPISLTNYQGLSLVVHPKGDIQDLYIELFDISGNPLGKQSLSWYAQNGKLTPNTWNRISIRFENLFPANQQTRPISGYAISTVHPGTIYVDSVHLETSVPGRPRWYEPEPIVPIEEEEKPEIPIPLSYTLKISPQVSEQWKTVFGRFELAPNGIRIGSHPEKTTGSMSYIRGGQLWTNYNIDTVAYWGQTASFSILVRYVDDANFTSCAFSHYNEVVQIYSVKQGVSTLIGASPGLPIRAYEPWKDARAGASVQGNRVSCYVDGERALTAEIPDMPAQGGAGIETWTRNTYDSPHTLQEFTVKPL